MTARSSVTACLLVLGVVLGGCGSTAKNAAPPPSQITVDFKGSPAPLVSLHDQANQLLGGGAKAFSARIASLKGYPIVVNKWGSWCGPCQSEFPVYQRVAAAYGRRVAFIGIDGKDRNAAATAFLKQFPVTYPSYTDPDEAVAGTIQARTYYPQTVFIDRSGAITYDHAGPYESAQQLASDIKRYAMQ
ncbi:MAG TPA: TlpA disulfide reductase family protein [Solirubrobacteraceae bacterium]|nr:TlpA disulfide reductase family protein [Solirubrobacteraceae bacterium]